MNPKKNLILLLVLLVAGVGYYLYDVKWAGEKKAEEDRKAKILKGVDSKRLMRISLQRKEAPFQLIRAEKNWRFVKPVDALMDEDQQEIVIKAAADLKPHRRLGKMSDISEFGLDKPRMTITFGLKDENEVIIHIGDRTPTREFRYASIKSNKSSIFTLKISDINKINKKVFELRDRAIVSMEPEEIQRFVVEPKGKNPFTVVRKGKEDWEMTAPVKDKADSTEADGVLSALKYKKVLRFVKEDPKDLTPYGLDMPVYAIRLFTDKKDKKDKKGDGILIGLPTEASLPVRQGKTVRQVVHYARRISGGPVMLIGNDVVKDFPREPFKLRNKNIIDFDVDHITRLKLERTSGSIDIKRLAKKKWDMRVTRPGGKSVQVPSRHKHIDDVLWDIKWANAVEFVDEPEDLAKYGLAPKGVNRVSVWIKKKKEGPEVKKSLTLGPLTGGKKTYGRLDGSKRLFAFDKKDFDKILRSSFQLSDRRLAKIEKEEDIARVAVKFPSGVEMLFRRSGEDWTIKHPSGRKANGGAIASLLTMLKDLEHEGEAKEGPRDFEKFRARVSLEDKSGKKFGPITFARGETKDWMFVKEGKGAKVLRVKKSQIGPNLPGSADALLEEKKKKAES
ncbi:MAG: hypothetical protein CMH76_03045 [Nitrospinae bacterium]|nr:hypothetical protein [Nitrospinota bacterium]